MANYSLAKWKTIKWADVRASFDLVTIIVTDGWGIEFEKGRA